MTEIAIQAKDLRKYFKDTQVLKGVDFLVRRGEIFALLGSNGAGKTTTIKILCTLLRPDGGSAAVCGYDVIHKPDKVRESISLTGQNTAVDNVLTGRENLRLIGKLYPLLGLLFISSAFAPTESMPGVVRAFAEHQPMTPIIEAVRCLLMNQPTGNSVLTAVIWCVGILIVFYVLATRIYKRKRA